MIYQDLENFKKLISLGPLIGLDIGKKKIGISISNKDLNLASPLEVIDATDLDSLHVIIQAYQPTGMIVGWPVSLDNQETEGCKFIMKVVEKINLHLNLPCFLFDERFTSKIANNFLMEFDFSRKKRHARDDKIAANILLSNFLDFFHNSV
ncbi:Holliday junction resolvase RuvX [Rickettsiales endosymbiont of Stachyamoeba lipophora]|uniref:Holliday junction resolvase RuvX n=1 Tax=Rickettsiales endosymbiont of Stachyamoeba lipophora TaxID=2486578 RepID=UPI0013DE34EA|nr:Holliday junction resolvase RuvX [Rickettsiales endosymbiont of Stachyamoeba lipophora]